jgi:hypothetical protein
MLNKILLPVLILFVTGCSNKTYADKECDFQRSRCLEKCKNSDCVKDCFVSYKKCKNEKNLELGIYNILDN